MTPNFMMNVLGRLSPILSGGGGPGLGGTLGRGRPRRPGPGPLGRRLKPGGSRGNVILESSAAGGPGTGSAVTGGVSSGFALKRGIWLSFFGFGVRDGFVW